MVKNDLSVMLQTLILDTLNWDELKQGEEQ